MGLKEKAITSHNSSLQKSSLFNNLQSSGLDQEELSPDHEKALDILKKKGRINKDEILKTKNTGLEKALSHYLLPDDITGSTLPADSEYSLNSRIESLINLIELSKELAIADNPEEIWESLLFSILGQVGAREAAIFIKEDARFTLKSYRGFVFPDNFHLLKRSGIVRVLLKDLNIRYAHKMTSELVGDEFDLFQSLQIELVIPILQFEELNGFILLGKPIGFSDYSIEDLLYLKLLGEIIGSFHRIIEQSEIFNNQKLIWNSREKIYQKYLYFQQQIQSGKSPEETQQIFSSYLSDLFAFEAYLLFILDEHEEYNLVAQKGLQENSYKNLKFSPEEELVFQCHQNHTWFPHENLKDEKLFNKHFSKEDLSIFKEGQILPLFFHGSLYGFFILLKVKNEISAEYMFFAQNIIITYFWFFLSHVYLKKTKASLKIAITDPMHGIKSAITRQEKYLEKKGTPFALYIVQIINLDRLENLFGENYAASVRKKIKKIISSEFSRAKFISDLFSNKFIIILEKTDKAQLWVYDKSLLKKINQSFEDPQKQPLLNNRLYARPEDKEKTLEQLINY